MDRIDAHAHLLADDPRSIALLDELGVRVNNICVATGNWRETVRPGYRELDRLHPRTYSWCTSFDLPDYTIPDDEYAARVISGLRHDLDGGAIAVKAWKNIGMELRRPDGSYAMIDDRIFVPIFEFLAGEAVPVVMHIGEPLACWLPLDEASPHYSYYRDHPEWYRHGRTDVPHHAQLIAARDTVLEEHPGLRVVGAHLGSLEHDVAEVASRLDRYPNFCVDVSARLGDLMRQDRSAVREFMVEYQDRVLFGSDMVFKTPLSTLPPAERNRIHQRLRDTYEAYFGYLETEGPITFGTCSSHGLALDPAVVEKLCSKNALAWYPRLRRRAD